MDGEPWVHVRPVAFRVTIWPPEADHPDADVWCVTVAHRDGLWAVLRGLGEPDEDGKVVCLNRADRWVTEAPVGRRDEAWLAAHRWPDFDGAMTVARREAPRVVVNYQTAAARLAAYLADRGHHV